MAIDRSRVLLRHIRRLTTEQADTALTDRELLQRFRDHRDETAFAALVRRHGRMVLATCRRVLHQEQDAEDAFQAVFVILARKASAPGWQESIGNWLYQVAYRLAVRARRQAARRQARAGAWLADRAQAQSIDPLAEVTLREAQRVLDDELNRLPEKYRSPLVLCCLEGHTQDEAAQQLGWSLATLKRRLQGGRDLLGTRLRRRGLTLSALLAGLTVAENASPAAVSDALLTSTVTAASASPGALSAQTSVLVRATLQAMLLSKVKVVVGAVAVVVGAAGVGAALFPPAPPAEKHAGKDAAPPTPRHAEDRHRSTLVPRNERVADGEGDPRQVDAVSDGKTPKEIKGWGSVTDPDGDCTFKADKGKLTITIPGNLHDLHPNRRMNAPRVLREAEGDFTATVKVTNALRPGKGVAKDANTAGRYAGLLLWADEMEYIRLERNARWAGDSLISFTPGFEYWKKGSLKQGAPGGGAADFFKEDSTWFKLERKGSKVIARCSHDGKEWALVKEVDTELPKKLHVGVAAINSSNTPFIVEFANLKVDASK